jgi:GNAT superfamily N-acetyltransferase
MSTLERSWRTRSVDDVPECVFACFYVRKGHRRQGVTSALIAAGSILLAQPAVEAYPVDGSVSTFTE